MVVAYSNVPDIDADDAARGPQPEYTIVVIPPPRSSQTAGAAVQSDPVRAAPRTTPEPAPRSTTGALTPIVLSEEVTAVLVRHLRHAATQLPTAKGADVAPLGTCRLASTAPAAPIPTGRVRRVGTENTGKKPATRRNRTTELAVQLAAANAELERLRADVAELRRTVVAPPHGPAVAASTDATQDPESSA